MKKRVLYGLAGIALIVVIVAVAIINNGDEVISSSVVSRPSKSVTKQLPLVTITEKEPALEKPVKLVKKTTPNAVKLAGLFGVHEAEASDFWNKIEDVEADAKKANVDIEFFGKVVDQNNQPVEGAKVSFHVSAENENIIAMSLRLGRENTPMRVKTSREVYSNESGVFKIGGLRGIRAYVSNIEKEGYLFHSSKSYTYSKRVPETLKQASAENPEIFVLWQQGEGQALVKTQLSGIIRAKNQLKPRPIRLVDSPNSLGYTEQGDFIITVFNQGRGRDEKGIAARKKYDWWVNIEAVNGGLLMANDIWLYEAPVEGYTKTLRFEKKGEASNWRAVLRNNKVYFKSHGNYGSANLEIITHANGDVGIYFKDVLINPTGSRNLEYDASKEIGIKY